MPGSEVVVTRTAYANNQSKYHLNDKPSHFTEVRERTCAVLLGEAIGCVVHEHGRPEEAE